MRPGLAAAASCPAPACLHRKGSMGGGEGFCRSAVTLIYALTGASLDTLCWYAPAGMPRWCICGNVAYFFQTVSYLFSFFFFSRIDWYKHVNMPQKIRNIRYIVVSYVATGNNVCHMIYARYHTLERKNTDLSGVSACEAAVAIFLLILPQIERKTSWNLIFPPIITCPGASVRSRSLENSLCGKISA